MKSKLFWANQFILSLLYFIRNLPYHLKWIKLFENFQINTNVFKLFTRQFASPITLYDSTKLCKTISKLSLVAKNPPNTSHTEHSTRSACDEFNLIKKNKSTENTKRIRCIGVSYSARTNRYNSSATGKFIRKLWLQ